MPNIDLDEAETALWNEVGSRGDAFRRAVRGRAAEQLRETGRRSEIDTANGNLVDAVLHEGEADDEESLVP